VRKENETPRNFDWLRIEEEIGALIEREARKRPSKMDMELIVDGLDCLYPFNAEEDDRRAWAAWLDFQKRYDLETVVHKQRIRSRRLVVALVLLLILALGTGLCYAFGFEIWHIAAEWTKEELLMVISPVSDSAEPEAPADSLMEDARAVWGDEVCDLLIENDISVQLPLWKPEGYELKLSNEILTGDDYVIISACYGMTDESEISIMVRSMGDAAVLETLILDFETDENLQRIYDYSGYKYYIMSNMERNAVTWNSGMNNIMIVGDFTSDEMYEMIHSVSRNLEAIYEIG